MFDFYNVLFVHYQYTQSSLHCKVLCMHIKFRYTAVVEKFVFWGFICLSEDECIGREMLLYYILSPLSDFAVMIAAYLAEIWEFLIFIGNISAVIVVLVGAILWFTDVNAGKGKGLVLSGILLAVVVQYFVIYPPAFVMS